MTGETVGKLYHRSRDWLLGNSEPMIFIISWIFSPFSVPLDAFCTFNPLSAFKRKVRQWEIQEILLLFKAIQFSGFGTLFLSDTSDFQSFLRMGGRNVESRGRQIPHKTWYQVLQQGQKCVVATPMEQSSTRSALYGVFSGDRAETGPGWGPTLSPGLHLLLGRARIWPIQCCYMTLEPHFTYSCLHIQVSCFWFGG